MTTFYIHTYIVSSFVALVYYTSYFLLEAPQTEIPRNDRSRPRSKPPLLTY